MPDGALPMPRIHLLHRLTAPINPYQRALELEVLPRDGDLVLRDQEHPPGHATEVVCLDGFAELQGRFGRFLAENDEIGEVGFGRGRGGGLGRWRGFAEDAAHGEDGEHGANDWGSGWKGEVAGVVLEFEE